MNVLAQMIRSTWGNSTLSAARLAVSAADEIERLEAALLRIAGLSELDMVSGIARQIATEAISPPTEGGNG